MNSSRTFFQGTASGLRRLASSKLISQSDLHSSTWITFWMALSGTPVVNTESFSGKVPAGSTMSAMACAVGVMKVSTTTLNSSLRTAS